MDSERLSFRNPLYKEKESKLLIHQRLKKRKEQEEARKEARRQQQEEDRLRILDEKLGGKGSPGARERRPWLLGVGNRSPTDESAQQKRPMHTRKDYNDAMRRLSNSKKSSIGKDKSSATKALSENSRSRHTDVYHASEFVVSDLVKPPKAGKKSSHSFPSTEPTRDAALCRICQSDEDTLSNQLVTPCGCTGTLQYVHHTCLQQWRKTKKASGADITKCELCLQSYDSQLLGNTDVQPDHTKKMQEDLRRLVRSGVYLMLLVDFCRDSFENLLQERSERRRGVENVPVEVHPPLRLSQPMQTLNNRAGNREGNRQLEPSDNESSDDNDEYVSRTALKRRSERLRNEK